MSGDSADGPKKRPTLDERPSGDRITRPSEPAMPLPPGDDDSRVTLEFQELPLSFAPDDGEDVHDDLPSLELPPDADEDQSDAALNLVGSRESHLSIDLRSEMHELFALDDFTAALGIAELLLGQNNADEDAQGVASECRRRLVQLYSSRLGDLRSVPKLAVPPGEIRWLGLDHRGGFLLSRVDGLHTVEELCDVSGMERLEALKTLVELRDAGAIRFD